MPRVLASSVLGLCLACGTAHADTFVKAWPLGEGHTRPESIVKGWDGVYYVSVQNTPDPAAADGEIIRLDVATGEVRPFVAPGGQLRNPRGLAFVGGVLVVTDTDRVWKIDKAGQVSPLATEFPVKPVLLNDTAAAKDGSAVFVSEMGPGRPKMRDPDGILWPTDSLEAEAIPTAARIYRIGLDGTVSEAVTPSRKLLVTNGVTQPVDGHLLALDFFDGNVVDVDLATDSKSIVAAGPFRGADGIEQGADGTIFVTGADSGRVWRMDRDGENIVKLYDLATDGGTVARQTFADPALDEAAGLLYVPDALHGTIVVLRTN